LNENPKGNNNINTEKQVFHSLKVQEGPLELKDSVPPPFSFYPIAKKEQKRNIDKRQIFNE